MVLLVEDYLPYRELFAMHLGDAGVEVLLAETQEEALLLFEKNKDLIEIIVMDACVPGSSPNTMGLIKTIKDSGFTKPIVGCSSGEDYNKILMEAGATHATKKTEVASFVLGMLNKL
jgi:DNA-binding response OmpR family regulator